MEISQFPDTEVLILDTGGQGGDLIPGLSLVERDHVTWIPASDWSWDLIPGKRPENIFRSRDFVRMRVQNSEPLNKTGS